MTLSENVIFQKNHELFIKYFQTRDKKLRNELVDSNIYIAEILSKRFLGRGIDYDDIFQIACMGLIYAVERYDPTRNVKFATFATPTIMGEIRKYFRDRGNFIRIPRTLYEIFYKAERIKRQSDSDISIKRLSRILQIPEESLQKAMNAGDKAFVSSLEYEADADGKLVLSGLLGYDDDAFMMIENADFINYCISNLSPKEKDFLEKRFFEEQSQSKIASSWGVSQMYISRLEKKVLKKIKKLYFKD